MYRVPKKLSTKDEKKTLTTCIHVPAIFKHHQIGSPGLVLCRAWKGFQMRSGCSASRPNFALMASLTPRNKKIRSAKIHFFRS